jgi:hypothetical protein
VCIDWFAIDVGGEVVSTRVQVDCLCTELADAFVLRLLVAGKGWAKAREELQGLVSRKFKEPVAFEAVISFEIFRVVHGRDVSGDSTMRRACVPMGPRTGESCLHVGEGMTGSVGRCAMVF